MLKLVKKSIVFILMVSLCIVAIPSIANAVSYPIVLFSSDENFENLVNSDEVVQGETYVIRMVWLAE